MSGHEEARQALEDLYLRCAVSDGSAEVWRDQVDEALDALDASVGQVVELQESLWTVTQVLDETVLEKGEEIAELRADLTGQVVELREALEQALDCKGSFNGTVSERGGEPAICTKCEAAARAAVLSAAGTEAEQEPKEEDGAGFARVVKSDRGEGEA